MVEDALVRLALLSYLTWSGMWVFGMAVKPFMALYRKMTVERFLLSSKESHFSFSSISLVIFNLKETTIPQIKAENISFGPYAFSFFATSNISRARKQ